MFVIFESLSCNKILIESPHAFHTHRRPFISWGWPKVGVQSVPQNFAVIFLVIEFHGVDRSQD